MSPPDQLAKPARIALAVLTLLPLTVGACGGPSAALDGSLYNGGGAHFQIAPIPQTWRRITMDGADIAYRDSSNEASVLVNAHCESTHADTPLPALTNQLVMGTTDRDFSSQTTEPFDGREALHSRLIAKLDGVPMGFDIFVMKKDGCVYDFVYISPRDHIEQGVPAFEQFTRGFHTIGRGET